MTATEIVENLSFDPYDREVMWDPHPVCRRLRDEAPLYYNEEIDFYALSRIDDVERAYADRDTFLSSKGVLLEMMQSGEPIPPGVVLMEDPPTHTIHRALLSRLFTARAVSSLEGKIRQLCCDLLDPLVGEEQFDVVEQFGVFVPSAVMCWLIGIPDEDQPRIRQYIRELREEGAELRFAGSIFTEYYDFRLEHPSDDIMTHLMTAEFEDETGTSRSLTRQECLSYLSNVNNAGHDTTKLAIGWAAKVLADHPDQRRMLVDDPSLIAGAFEETLRYEPPTMQTCRYTSREVERYNQVIPEGSIVALVGVAANRDERRFADPDRFDVRRSGGHHVSFGFGADFCLGAALSRLEGRIAIEELLKRFPEWDVDLEHATYKPSPGEVRGWDSLPLVVH